jgi:glycosyltransferase involved in cell wall biosynthesis
MAPVSRATFAENAHPGWPGRRLPERPLAPPPGFGSCTLGAVECDVAAVCVLGLRGHDLEHAVALVADDQRTGRGFKPVFLTDTADFGPMVRHGFAVEFIPEQATLRDDFGLPTSRHAFLARKWGFSRIIDLRTLRAPVASTAAPSVPLKAAVPVATKLNGARRGRAAVISWDLGHNPVGRAMVLYDLLERDWDVELVGPLWSRFGGRVWEPIAGSARKVRGFACDTLEDFWPTALAIASAADYDLIVVCKPRLPGLLLGALLKRTCNCPMILDIDDFELSFFKDATTASLDQLAAAGVNGLREPYGELATRACDGVVGDADALVVSNVALRDRFGGTIVRHARDEAAFDADRFDRLAERRRMGISDDDFALVFVGTARAHKGVFDIAHTLSELPEKRFVLHLVGDIPDRRVRNELDRHNGARIVYHPNCAFIDLPARIVAADAVVLLQDESHPISQFQIPAKVSDASGFGLPILVTDVPPLRDLILQGVARKTTARELGAQLMALLAERENGRSAVGRVRVREAFEAELGFRVNRERLTLAVARAAKAGPGLPPSFARLIDIAAKAYADLRAGQRPSAPAVSASARTPVDLVMFWKQNDSGLFGRRSDMLMKHLLGTGRIGRVLQIDAPVEVTDLARLAEAGRGSAAPLILANTVDNQFCLRDRHNHHLRTYLWSRKGRVGALPEVGRSMADYPNWVEAQMARAGISAQNALAWVCPVVFDFPAVARQIPFRGIIGDLIDDQRTFQMSAAYRSRIIASYEETLPFLDLAFTNCVPMAEVFAGLTRCGIQVIPNGTEAYGDDAGPIPAMLANLPRPVAGYVGNLRDRIDWELLRDIALALPQVSFAIMGGGARAEDVARLADIPNVTFTGVVPYAGVPACIRAFDVALVPHLRNHLTASMNPLKLYNYFAAARPIVSTEVENVDAALQPFIRFAATPEAFAAAILDATADPPLPYDVHAAVMSGITWENRARTVLDAIDGWMATAQ